MCSLERRGSIFYLTLTGEGEHRLSPTVIAQIRSALQQVRDQSPASGSALVTTAQGSKFFSNGFDLAWAARPQPEGFGSGLNGLRLMVDLFRPVVADMISLPMPTVAVVTGHAAAAGMLLALCHDYVFMREDRGVLYMSELDMGITLPDYFMAAIRSKIVSPATRRDVLLKASKLRAAEAAKMGIIDSAHENGEKAMEAAVHLAEQLVKRKWDGEVYREIRKDMYPELCGVLGLRAKEMVSASSKL